MAAAASRAAAAIIATAVENRTGMLIETFDAIGDGFEERYQAPRRGTSAGFRHACAVEARVVRCLARIDCC